MTFFTDSRGPDEWRRRLARVVEQEPLILTRPSRPAVASLREAPRMVYLGVGLCSRHHLSVGLPIDILGLILPAEAIRRAVGASQLLVLVADAHAMTNHLPALEIERRARLTVQVLARIARRLGLSRMVVVRASMLGRGGDYDRVLRPVVETSQGRHHPYVLRQVADVAYLTKRFGTLVKVGWSLGPERARHRHTDEVSFDRWVTPLSGVEAAYVYCWPGRALDDDRGRAPPYIVRDPGRRILLHGSEDVARKLERAADHASLPTVRAVRNHLRRLATSYARTVTPIQAPTVELRMQRILDHVFRPAALTRATPATPAARARRGSAATG